MPRELAPGESARIQFPLSPEICRKLDAGALFSIVEGPILRISRGRFKRECEIYVDSEREGCMTLEWEERESWFLYLARRIGLLRKEDGLTLGDYATTREEEDHGR